MTGKRMFVSDLDGTLLCSDHSFSKKDLNALEQLGSMGVIRVLATGRSVFSLKRSVPERLPFDYLVFSTGLGVAPYPDTAPDVIKSDCLTSDQIKNVTEIFKEMALDFMIHAPIPDNHTFLYYTKGEPNSDFRTRIDYYKNYCGPLEERAACLNTASQFITMVHGENGIDIYHELKSRLADFSVVRATSPFDGETTWIEVFPENVSKGTAVLWLARHLGIDRDSIAAVGNDYNDESLLSVASSSFVVENAPDDLKNRFTVVPSNNCNGVREALKLAYSSSFFP